MASEPPSGPPPSPSSAFNELRAILEVKQAAEKLLFEVREGNFANALVELRNATQKTIFILWRREKQ